MVRKGRVSKTRTSRARGAMAAGAGAVSPPGRAGSGRGFGERVDAGQEPVGDRDLTPPRHAELLAQDVGVSFHRAGRDAELGSDLLVREPQCYQLDDLALTLGDRRRCLRERLVHAAELTIGYAAATSTERSIRPEYLRLSGERLPVRGGSSPRGRGDSPPRAPPRRAHRRGAAARARRGGASASS